MHLEETDKSAVEMFDRLVSQMAAGAGTTDELKATDQIGWWIAPWCDTCAKDLPHERFVAIGEPQTSAEKYNPEDMSRSFVRNCGSKYYVAVL